jgi:alkaline phosphatase D
MSSHLARLAWFLCTLWHARCEFVASFDHGVASGDPLPGNVVIWTKVTPRSAALQSIYVDFRVSQSSLSLTNMFSLPAANGTTKADQESDFTVKVEVGNLEQGKVAFPSLNLLLSDLCFFYHRQECWRVILR